MHFASADSTHHYNQPIDDGLVIYNWATEERQDWALEWSYGSEVGVDVERPQKTAVQREWEEWHTKAFKNW